MLYPYTRDYIIVPTPVGVNRRNRRYVVVVVYCPHARGGEPSLLTPVKTTALLSPRPWG